MMEWERAKYVARIVAGEHYCSIDDIDFVIRSPTRHHYALAENIYEEYHNGAVARGALTEEELLNILKENLLWEDADEIAFKTLETQMEDMKVGLYEMMTRSIERNKIRAALTVARTEYSRLFTRRHAYDHLTAAGIAGSAKQRFLTGCSLYYEEDDTPYWKKPSPGWISPDNYLDKILSVIMMDRLGESQLREIVRTEPWRTMWSCAKHAGRGVFDVGSADLSADQRVLLIWSGVYDSIRDHPDCPSDDIIEDDDMIDGWMILKRREREKDRMKKMGDDFIKNEKIKNSGEIFVMADTAADVKKILQRNDGEAQMAYAQRMAAIKNAPSGGIAEQNMPDTVRKNQMEVVRRFSEHANRK